MMKPKLRRIAVPITAAALVASALGASTASSQISTTLPSLAADELLTIANVDAPPAGVELELHIDFPVENPLTLGGVGFTALTAVVKSDRSVDMQSAVTAQGSSGSEAPECTDHTFMPTGRTWAAQDLPVVWEFRRNSTPPVNSILKTRRSLRLAHRVWPNAINNCSSNDTIDFSYNYAGPTSRTVKYDQHNIVEFGPLGGGALAINYTWYSGTRILETDLRFNRNDYRWTNIPGGAPYQVKNVATHELGHQLGLDDLGDPHGALTMFGKIRRGELKKTTLGAGDLRGASRLSP